MKKLILFALMMIMLSSSVSAITTDGLISYWDMDINENDQVSDNNPTASGCSIETNGALGNSTYCNLNKITYDMTKFNVDPRGNYTQIIWVNYTTIPVDTGIGGIWSLGAADGLFGGGEFNGSNIYWNKDIINDPITTYYGNDNVDTLTSDFNVINTQIWYMIAVTYDGTTIQQASSENGVIQTDGNASVPTLLLDNTGIFYIGGRADGDVAQLKEVNFDEISLWNRTLNHSELKEIYNGGIPLPLSSYTGPSGIVGFVTVGLEAPPTNHHNDSTSMNFTIAVNSTNSSLSQCDLVIDNIVSAINTTPVNNSFTQFFNVAVAEGWHNWTANCSDANGNVGNTTNRTLAIDTTNPEILASYNNIVWNGTIHAMFNFSDNIEIYSINITYGNGSIIYNQTGIGNVTWQYNLSDTIYEIGNTNITARVCDTHTASLIDVYDYKVENKGIKYIFKKWFWFFDDVWIHIYPKDSSLYNSPTTEKEKDRYVFKFNKDTKPLYTETFVVESSEYIDIAKMQRYDGHLIVPSLERWIDFENTESTKTDIKRISPTKIEVTIYGLKSQEMIFNSIGELNCMNETFNFANINPEASLDPYVIVGSNNSFKLNISNNDLVFTSINATLHYNNTDFFAGSTSNFTSMVTAPTKVGIPSSNVSLYWLVNIDDVVYNLSSSTATTQNVSDFYLDNCTQYSTTAINFTIWDEETPTTDIAADVTGEFIYTYGNITKEYDYVDLATNTSDICIFPFDVTFDVNYTILYEESSYPQRRYYVNEDTINNATQQISLYLLDSALGIYARFRVVDNWGNSLSGVSGRMQREIGGVLTTIEQEDTDASGLATFWVNPDNDYIFTFSLSGYGSETFTLRPTSSEVYTVTLGGSATARNVSYGVGIDYGFYPNTDLQNDTMYDLSFSMDSDYWAITGCTLYLKNGTNTINSSSTSYTTTSCDIKIPINANGYSSIISQVVYNLNNSDDLIVSTQYLVVTRYEGDFSLKSFLDDLKLFGGAGFNNFTRMFIAFVIIFLILASVAYNMGVIDPEVTIGLLIMLTWFFSYVGWMTIPFDSITTTWLKQYILAILITLGGGAFIMKRAIE